MKKITGTALFILSISLLWAGNSEQPYKGWLKTETEHFTFIYEDISRESVVELTEFGEDVYKSVTTFFDSYPKKITVVLRDRIDFSNGSYNPAPPHINLYLTTPGSPELGAGVDNWLRFVLTHELVHYVNMNLEEGLFYNLSRILGKSVASVPGGLLPGWAIEGIAVKLESDFTEGGRGNNPFFEIFSRSLILEDKMFSWRQAAYSSFRPPLNRIYIAGYILNDYMARRFGDDIFIRVYREFLKFPLAGFNYYIKRITGSSISTIFTDMKEELKVKYSTTYTDRGTLLSPDTESNYYLPVVTDAGWICYRETGEKESGIVLINPETKKETVLINTRLTDYSSFSASQDGNFIVFSSLNISSREPSGLTAGSDLYLYNRNTGKTIRITSNSHLRQPAISSDGKRIVAVQLFGQYSRLVEVDISTGKTRIIFDRKSRVFNPVFSKYDNSIAFAVQNKKNRTIWLINSRGDTFPLTDNIPGNDYNPSFSSEESILFVSDLTGTPELYEINTYPGSGIEKILSDPGGIFSGISDKNKIIYSTWNHRGYILKEAQFRSENYTIPLTLKNYSEPVKDTDDPKKVLFSDTIREDNYIDLPKMVVTIPLPFYIDPLYKSDQLFGPGFRSYFQSVLGKNIIDLTVTLNTDSLQPGISFEYIHDWGSVSLDYLLNQGYSPSKQTASAQQTTNQQLLLNFPLISSRNLGISSYLGLFTGIINNYSVVSNIDFTFLAPLPDSSTGYSSNTYQINGIGFSMERNSSVKDIIPPWKIVLSAMVYTPVDVNFLRQFAFKNTTSINFPSLLRHQVIRVSSRLTYSAIEKLSYLNNPRGFPNDSPDAGGVIPALDYLFTIAAPDLPILGGLSLQGIAGAFHLEKIFNIGKNSIIPGNNIYGGIELMLLGNYINVFETAGIGISYRFTPDSTDFSSSNMGIYIFAGTNSFIK